MRFLLVCCLLPMLATLSFAQEKKDKDARVQPIKVVVLDRKEPVTYEKDIEPIFVNNCHCRLSNWL